MTSMTRKNNLETNYNIKKKLYVTLEKILTEKQVMWKEDFHKGEFSS